MKTMLIRTLLPGCAGVVLAGGVAGCASKKEEVHIYRDRPARQVAHETRYEYEYDYDRDGREVEVERRVYPDHESRTYREYDRDYDNRGYEYEYEYDVDYDRR